MTTAFITWTPAGARERVVVVAEERAGVFEVQEQSGRDRGYKRISARLTAMEIFRPAWAGSLVG